MLVAGHLVERVADIVLDVAPIGADVVSSPTIEADATALDLDHQHAEVRVRDHEIGLAIIRSAQAVLADPCYLVEDAPVITQFAGEGFVEPAFGRGFGPRIEQTGMNVSHEYTRHERGFSFQELHERLAKYAKYHDC